MLGITMFGVLTQGVLSWGTLDNIYVCRKVTSIYYENVQDGSAIYPHTSSPMILSLNPLWMCLSLLESVNQSFPMKALPPTPQKASDNDKKSTSKPSLLFNL